MLTASGNKLFYYTFASETSNHNYEIDFLLSRGNKVCPLEVKSSGYATHTSIDLFAKSSLLVYLINILFTQRISQGQRCNMSSYIHGTIPMMCCALL